MRAVNESVFQMRRILGSQIENFIQYYSVEVDSESDEEEEEEHNDFEDDGKSVLPQREFVNNQAT